MRLFFEGRVIWLWCVIYSYWLNPKWQVIHLIFLLELPCGSMVWIIDMVLVMESGLTFVFMKASVEKRLLVYLSFLSFFIPANENYVTWNMQDLTKLASDRVLGMYLFKLPWLSQMVRLQQKAWCFSSLVNLVFYQIMLFAFLFLQNLVTMKMGTLVLGWRMFLLSTMLKPNSILATRATCSLSISLGYLFCLLTVSWFYCPYAFLSNYSLSLAPGTISSETYRSRPVDSGGDRLA